MLSITATANAAEQTGERLISADLNEAQGPMTRMPELCVGAGRANEGLRADWQKQLAEVHDQCGFRYLRFHGLLCDDMGVYFVDRQGGEHYNWQYVDQLFDALLATGVRPFVELGFMPSALASGPSTIFWWKGNVTPPKDYAKWDALIKALVAHWTERYGEDEVATWYFEVWNEPNLSGFWIGDKKGMDDKTFSAYAQAEYFKLYSHTAKAVKAVSPRYRVGGPATAGNGWIDETIKFAADNKLPLDFISTHNYTVTAGFLDENGTAGTVFCPNRDAMIVDAKRVRGQIEASARPGLELHYTEWSSSYTPSDPLHDSYHSAAFILSKLKGVGEAAQSMSYWTFTDIFEESGPRYTPFHGGFGLLNYQGIRKPSFYAYQFLNRMGTTALKNADAESWVTKNANGDVQALVWDFTITGPGEKLNNQQYYNHIHPAEPAAPAHIVLKHFAPGAYRLTGWKVGYKSNDAYTAYLEMGAPNQLTKVQVADLKKASEGLPFLDEIVTVGPDGVFDRSYSMRQNDVILLTLEKR
jgi:xylan 1,4-beta-xylosidase